MTTAEYAIGTVAACGFGGVLYKLITSDTVFSLLTKVISRALSMGSDPAVHRPGPVAPTGPGPTGRGPRARRRAATGAASRPRWPSCCRC